MIDMSHIISMPEENVQYLPNLAVPERIYTKAVQPEGMAWLMLDPGSILKSRYMVGFLVYTGDWNIILYFYAIILYTILYCYIILILFLYYSRYMVGFLVYTGDWNIILYFYAIILYTILYCYIILWEELVLCNGSVG